MVSAVDSNRIAACANTRLPTLLPNGSWPASSWRRPPGTALCGRGPTVGSPHPSFRAQRSVSGRLGRVSGRAARTCGRRSSLGGAPPAGVGRHLLARTNVLDLAPEPAGARLRTTRTGSRAGRRSGSGGRTCRPAAIPPWRSRGSEAARRPRPRRAGDPHSPRPRERRSAPCARRPAAAGSAAGPADGSPRSRARPRGRWCGRRWRGSRSARRRRSPPRTRSRRVRFRRRCRCSSPDRGRSAGRPRSGPARSGWRSGPAPPTGRRPRRALGDERQGRPPARQRTRRVPRSGPGPGRRRPAWRSGRRCR